MSDVMPVKHSRTRSRLSFLAVAGLFLAPVILAWSVFYLFPQWRPEGTSNNGELVEPVRPLPVFNAQTDAGQVDSETLLRGKWTLAYLAQGNCTESCIERLYTVRQIRLSQGKNIDRLQRLLFWQDIPAGVEARAQLQEKFPGLVIVPVAGMLADQVQQTFQVGDINPLQSQYYYLVDPLGNLMMRYAPDSEPKGTMKDLERLLKYSGLG